MNSERRIFSLATIALAVAASFGSLPARASDASDAAALVQTAQATINTFVANKDFPSLPPALAKAVGVLVFPQVLKAGFVLGGSGGTGVLLVRDAASGDWVGPAFYTIGSASFGLQAGAQSAEVVMVIQSQKALDSIYSNKVKLGGDMSVAVGPKGSGGAAALSSDFLAFSTTKGLFAGIAFDGSVVDVRQNLNAAYYGPNTSPIDIVVKRTAVNPAAEPLRQTMKSAAKS
jgi:SH3 domain-containing YSC84-like protein 1